MNTHRHRHTERHRKAKEEAEHTESHTKAKRKLTHRAIEKQRRKRDTHIPYIRTNVVLHSIKEQRKETTKT